MQIIARVAVVLGALLMLAGAALLYFASPYGSPQEDEGWSTHLLVAAGGCAVQGFTFLLFGTFGAALVRLSHAAKLSEAWAGRRGLIEVKSEDIDLD